MKIALRRAKHKIDPVINQPDPSVSPDVYGQHGVLVSTAQWNDIQKRNVNLTFKYKELSEIALTAASAWMVGDYFEFGSQDLATFRNMLSAYDIFGRDDDTHFYAFDAFGDFTDHDRKFSSDVGAYIAPYAAKGDSIEYHKQLLHNHQLFENRCHLVQGLFQDTLTNEFKADYQSKNRQISFAFLDCNLAESYKCVFEFIHDLMAANSYIYMDEYYCKDDYYNGPFVIHYFRQFSELLEQKRGIKSEFMRNSAGYGALFRLYPRDHEAKSLSL
jgi:hypothetical protein